MNRNLDHLARVRAALTLAASLLLPQSLWGGGSGFNTVVVVNQASSNSVALGNYYCELRQVPPQNLLRIQWAGGNVEWALSQCQTVLLAPLQSMLTNRSLAGQVDYVVLSMDIPYRVTDTASANSTTSVLFYGFRTNGADSSGCVLPDNTLSDYAFSEQSFRQSASGSSSGAFLATMLTGRTLALAKALADQGVASDGQFPQQPLWLEKTSDVNRSVRFFSFDNAMFDLRLSGRVSVVRTNSDQTAGLTNLLGLQTGLATLTLSPNTFVPGAMADSLTSFGGKLFENNDQTSLLAFTEAGAAGSYGTVVEPCNYQEKFPDPLDYFYGARGFTLAECYYLSLRSPYEGLIVGEPLAAPFARHGTGRWVGLATNALLTGTVPLTLEFAAADASRPLQQVDLFVDGIRWGTLTNIPPAAGSVLTVKLNNQSANYTVPAGATLDSVTAGLAAVLNANPFSRRAQIRAFATGDRIELDSTNVLVAGDQVSLTASAAAAASTLSLSGARGTFLDSTARGWRAWRVAGTPGDNDFLQAVVTKTNGEVIELGVTNRAVSLLDAGDLTRQLMAQLNAHPSLNGADGVSAEDTYGGGASLTFLLYARGPGLAAAQVQMELRCSANLQVTPAGALTLEDNVGDLRPRNHLYLTAGVTNLQLAFALPTAGLADGPHELTAVAYEGSNVRTQTRTRQTVQVRNTSLTASLNCSASLGVAALSDTLQFAVVASANPVSRIELFSTGGSLGTVSGQASAAFAIPAAQLGEGLHPFYALVTDAGGRSCRSETVWIRLSAAPLLASFRIQMGPGPGRVTWPGVAGYAYDILSAEQLPGPFVWRATVPATNTGLLDWNDAGLNGWQRFYQVRGQRAN